MTTPTREQVLAMIAELRERADRGTSILTINEGAMLHEAADMLEAMIPNDQPDATP